MRTSRGFALAMLGLVAMLMPVHLAAQSGTFRITVPFDFAAGSQPFPAGEYWVSSNADGLIHLSSGDGRVNQAMLANPVYPKNRENWTGLVFRRYGSVYFLSRIWSGSDRGNELPKSAAEREMTAGIGQGVRVKVAASRQ